MTAEQLAELFHATYEELAPLYGYKTREESSVHWNGVPDANKNLMVATCDAILHLVDARWKE